jgi:hypothetical protein
MLTTSPSDKMLQAAQDLLEAGYSVIPVARNKKPFVSRRFYQKSLPSLAVLTTWWEQYPEANIGIVTGRISNLVVFDADSEKAETFITKQGGFPVCPQSITAQGRHYFFKHPGFDVKPNVDKQRDLDIRGDAAYVVVPPSVHESGHVYEWAPDLSLFHVKPPGMRRWQEEYVRNHCGTNVPSVLAENPASWELRLLKGVFRGKRNNACAKLAGLRPSEVFFLLFGWNMCQNRPPLKYHEIRRTVKSIVETDRRNKVTSTEATHEGIQFSVNRNGQASSQSLAVAR